jgi:hypothetical protein
MTNEPMTVTSRSVTLRDFAIFQLKLVLDGSKDFLAIWLSVAAIVLDFVAGRGRRPRLFYSVVRASERFDKWLNLHSVVEQMDASGGEDGLFGASDAGSDTFVGQVERLVRGGETERSEAMRQLKQRGEELTKKVVRPPDDPE